MADATLFVDMKNQGEPTGVLNPKPYREEGSFPMLIQPGVDRVDIVEWIETNRSVVEDTLFKYGALLFRGFDVTSVSRFQDFIRASSDDLMAYRERSSPRTEVGDSIYTSTDYAADQEIFPHNEHSYASVYPLKIYFNCVTPAEEGGETPIVDCRKLVERIDPDIVEKFHKLGWMYVRNFGNGIGLPWQNVFQTENPSDVEVYCQKNKIQFEWKQNGQLRTRQIRPAITTHPQTQEKIWFNHAAFFHVSTLAAPIRDILVSQYQEEDLPNQTYYGDGTPIEPDALDEIRQAYREQQVIFAWRTGDILMLDNMLTAHARKPFRGMRKVLVGMAEPYKRVDL